MIQVPFRLTRMLVKAMEVSGIEGNFRSTCENVMQVLRTNKDSVMAMMEVEKARSLLFFVKSYLSNGHTYCSLKQTVVHIIEKSDCLTFFHIFILSEKCIVETLDSKEMHATG